MYDSHVWQTNTLERLHRKFLFGSLGVEFKYHLVRWSKVCSPIANEGLGVRKLGIFDQASLEKWFWLHGKDSFVETEIATKYGEEWGGWTLEPVRGTHNCSLWISIRTGWDIFLSCVL